MVHPAKLRRVSWECVHFELWPEQDDVSAIAALRASGLAVFELEKAVYELRYELNNRPDWVAIPVAGILRLLESE